jgi:hypothetical protein
VASGVTGSRLLATLRGVYRGGGQGIAPLLESAEGR